MSAESLVRRYFEEVFNETRADICEELVAPRYVEHAIPPFASTEPGEVAGPSHTRSVVEWLRAQFPDLRMTVEGGGGGRGHGGGARVVGGDERRPAERGHVADG
jgi:hypothetical protein